MYSHTKAIKKLFMKTIYKKQIYLCKFSYIFSLFYYKLYATLAKKMCQHIQNTSFEFLLRLIVYFLDQEKLAELQLRQAINDEHEQHRTDMLSTK